MRKTPKIARILALCAVILPQGSGAIAASQSETQGYLGLAFPLSGSAGPEVILGAVRATTNSDGDVRGLRAALHLGVNGGLRVNSLRLSALAGRSTWIGEIGAGFGLGGGIFPTWGISGSHMQIGGAFGANAPSGVTFGFTTLQDFALPEGEDDAVIVPPPPLCPVSLHTLAC